MEAPELMESDDLSCYFKRQPRTEAEVSQAIEAINVSCCEAVLYVGNDRSIIRRIIDHEYEGLDTVPNAKNIDVWLIRLKRMFKLSAK